MFYSHVSRTIPHNKKHYMVSPPRTRVFADFSSLHKKRRVCVSHRFARYIVESKSPSSRLWTMTARIARDPRMARDAEASFASVVRRMEEPEDRRFFSPAVSVHISSPSSSEFSSSSSSSSASSSAALSSSSAAKPTASAGSESCVKVLHDLQDCESLETYLTRNKPLDSARAYSICAQICNIYLLYYGVVQKPAVMDMVVCETKHVAFEMNQRRISFEGVRVVALGATVLASDEETDDDEEKLFTQIYYSTMPVLMNVDSMLSECKIGHVISPMERGDDDFARGVHKIVTKHASFLHSVLLRYGMIFRSGRSALEEIIQNSKKDGFYAFRPSKMLRQQHVCDFLNRMLNEFALFHPMEYKEYFGWASLPSPTVPAYVIQALMLQSDVFKYVEALICFTKQ